MQVKGIFNQLFRGNRNISVKPETEKSKGEQLEVQSLNLNRIFESREQAQEGIEKLKGKNPVHAHKLRGEGAERVLKHEPESRLNHFREQILKETLGRENRKAAVNSETMAHMQKLLRKKST
jgi:hypothetical protein